MKGIIVYDIEIAHRVEDTPGGWNNPHGMGFGSAVTYSFKEDKYLMYLHERGKELLIEQLSGNYAVSFNGVKFDSRNVLGNDRPIEHLGEGLISVGEWVEVDLMIFFLMARDGLSSEEVLENIMKGAYWGRGSLNKGNFNLDTLCQRTLGAGKSGSGAHAPVLYQKENYAALLSYNLQDVRLTGSLFRNVMHSGGIDTEGGKVLINLPPDVHAAYDATDEVG